MRRPACSQLTSLPSRSKVLPLELYEGVRKTLKMIIVLEQAHHPVVRNVAEDQIAARRVISRAFGPAKAGRDPFDGGQCLADARRCGTAAFVLTFNVFVLNRTSDPDNP
jgi:hypothetical protein